MKNYKLLPKITLLTLMLLGIVFIAMFYFGGNAGVHEVAGDVLDVPRFTDAFLVWNYILFGIVVLITLGVVVVEFVNNWKNDRSKAIKTLCVVLGFVLLACICWFLGSPDKVNIIGYEGTDNQGVMAKFSDMCIFTAYILFAGTILSMLVTFIISKLK